MQNHPIVSREEWIEARKKLLEREKEQTRLRDAVNAERLKLPWVRIEKSYAFDTTAGKKTLSDLFEGRSQLIIDHFMLGPGWSQGCVGCSFEADHIEPTLTHLNNHDVSLVVVSRAPLSEIQAFQKRMGWTFPWVSSYGDDFNYDFGVSFTPEEVASKSGYYNYHRTSTDSEEKGFSSFYKNDKGEIFHTYSRYGRGVEDVMATYDLLDWAPLGRNEPTRGNLTEWVRHHDRYGTGGGVSEIGRAIDAPSCHKADSSQ